MWASLSAMDDVANELRHDVDTLTSHAEVATAVMAAETYIVTWCTLAALVASFISRAFDLGLDDEDVSFTTLMRTSHVKNSEILEIVKTHRSKVQHDHFSRLRNDIVHRGRLNDATLIGLWDRLRGLDLMKMLGQDVSEEREQILSELVIYLSGLQLEFDKHLESTLVMIDELVEYVHEHLAELETKAKCWPL